MRKIALFNLQSREEQAHYVYHENARFQEVLRDKQRKIGNLTTPDFWSECKERSDGIVSILASKTSRSGERGRGATELALPSTVA